VRDTEIIDRDTSAVGQLYEAARRTYAARTGRGITSDTTATEWRILEDEGLSTVAASFAADFDLPESPAAVLSRAARPLGSSYVYVSMLPRSQPGTRGPLRVRLDVLARFRPALLRDPGVRAFLGRAGATTPDQVAAETAAAVSQAEQLRRDTAKADAQAGRVQSAQLEDLTASAEMVGDFIARAAGGVVSVAARVLGSGVGAFVGALPPVLIVGLGVVTVAAGVYAVRRITA
jgi:hypothetical protein